MNKIKRIYDYYNGLIRELNLTIKELEDKISELKQKLKDKE